MAKRKAEVFKERQAITYAEMQRVPRIILDKVKKDPEGAFYQRMANLIFTAFMLEPFLNHAGKSILKCWSNLEWKLSPLAKFNLITEKLGIEKDDCKLRSRRPLTFSKSGIP